MKKICSFFLAILSILILFSFSSCNKTACTHRSKENWEEIYCIAYARNETYGFLYYYKPISEEEYNQREANLYKLFEDYEKVKTELYEELFRLGKSPKGSWFELNRINNLNRCDVPINTYINLDYIDKDSLPTGMTITNEKVLFESVVTYMKNGTPCILSQKLTRAVENELMVYQRLQVANGTFDENNWGLWRPIAFT